MPRLDLDALEARYAVPVIPPCRICGAPLEIHAIGGGMPTKYFCSAALSKGEGKNEWDHFSKSEYSDLKRGGDPEVVRLVARARLAERMAEATRCHGTKNGKHEWRAGEYDDAREKSWCCRCARTAMDILDATHAVLREWDALNIGCEPESGDWR